MSAKSDEVVACRVASLEQEIEIVRQKQASQDREFTELKTRVANCATCERGDVDIAAGPVKLHGSGKWLAAIVIVLVAAVCGSNGKVVTWIEGIFK